MGEVSGALWHAALETGTATITPDMVFRDAWEAAKAASRATPALPPRAPCARPLRVRVCLDAVDGPAWLGLLCQCAWLRGGILGTSAGLPAEG